MDAHEALTPEQAIDNLGIFGLVCAHAYNLIQPEHYGEAMAAWHRTATFFRSALEEKEKYLDLLAIIHRDGGHHTAKVGLKQSVEDAIRIWYERLAEREALLKERDELQAQLNSGRTLRFESARSLSDVQLVRGLEADNARLRKAIEDVRVAINNTYYSPEKDNQTELILGLISVRALLEAALQPQGEESK